VFQPGFSDSRQWPPSGARARIQRAHCDGLQEKAQMIPKAISKPTANAAPTDSATAATGFIGRGALLIGTIYLPN